MSCRGGAARSAQRGIAVITVLLALAIAVLISSEVIMRVYMGMKRSESHFNGQQAWQYALGGEAWARQQLAKDFQQDKQRRIDHFFEDWAVPLHEIEVDGGFIEVRISDMQSRFNLNNLVDEKGVAVEPQIHVLRRLFSFVGVNSSYADVAARWASYAEDNGSLYGKEAAPYNAGDTQFGHVSELRLLPDLEPDAFLRVAPLLAALPEPVKININTAPEEVLAALIPRSEALPGEKVTERLQQFIERRSQAENGFDSPELFINIMGVQSEDLQKEDLSVESEYFEVKVHVEYQGSHAYLISTLFRDTDTGEISLLSRDRSQRFVFRESRHQPDGKQAGKCDEDNDKDCEDGEEEERQSSKRKKADGRDEKTGRRKRDE